MNLPVVIKMNIPSLFSHNHRLLGVHGGSISAEHGIGQLKKAYLSRSKSPKMIETMRSVKNLFDPHGIMNPLKVLP